MPQKVGSIRDVARRTGLSTATISRVMNGASNVSEATRKKVLAASEELAYLPNPAARSLTTARSKTVAAIIPTIEHSVYAKFIAGIERTLTRRGYSLVLAISDCNSGDEHAAAKKLLGMGAEAFILSGAHHNPKMLALFKRRQIPFAFTSVWDPCNPIPTIGYDNEALAHRAVTHLTQLGHRRIAVLHGPKADSDRTRARIRGAQSAQASDIELTFLESPLNVAGGKTSAAQLISASPRHTAVLCFSDVLALGAYFAASVAGLTIPQDLSVMGFDNLDWSAETTPALTTIALPAAEIGTTVATQIADHLEHGSNLRAVRVACDIIERGSVAPCP